MPEPTQPSLRRTVHALWNNPAAFHLIGGGSVATLWGWGLLWWVPTYLIRAFGLSAGEAGALLGPMHLIGGGLATLATLVAVTPLARSATRHVSTLMAVVLLIATAPSMLLLLSPSLTVVRLLLWIVVPAIYFFIGPTMGLLQNVVAPGMRAQSIAVLMLVANIFNLIVAPQAIGIASDLLSGLGHSLADSLRLALLGLAPTGLWAGAHYALAARSMRSPPTAAD
jgi:hypothetical protein